MDPNVRRWAALLTAAIVAMTPVGAQADASPDTFDVLPDPYYVTQECARLADASRAYPALQQEHAAVAAICTRYTADGNGAAWLEAITPHTAAIDKFDPNAGRYSGTALNSDQPVPQQYNVYALFLTTSDNYVTDLPSFNALFAAFKSFGDAIGSNRLAVWFRQRPPDIGPDVKRSMDYADRFKIQNLHLTYNDGPYLVLTSKFPDNPQNLDDVTILRLNGLAPANTVNLLNVVAQDLRTQATIDKRALVYEDVKQKLLSTLQSHPDLLKNIALFVVSGSGADKIVQSAFGATPASSAK
jgi:hypothetical protein